MTAPKQRVAWLVLWLEAPRTMHNTKREAIEAERRLNNEGLMMTGVVRARLTWPWPPKPVRRGRK